MIKEQIERVGQPYFDEPVRVLPIARSPIEDSVGAAFNPHLRQRMPITVRHERVQLRWMKPGPDGKLVPR